MEMEWWKYKFDITYKNITLITATGKNYQWVLKLMNKNVIVNSLNSLPSKYLLIKKGKKSHGETCPDSI